MAENKKIRRFLSFATVSHLREMVNNVRGRPCVASKHQGFDGHESESGAILDSNEIRLTFYGSYFLADKSSNQTYQPTKFFDGYLSLSTGKSLGYFER